MPAKKPKLLIAATAVAAGSAAVYFYVHGLSQQVSNPQDSAKVVPDEAMMAAFISPNPQALSQLQQFGTPGAQKLVGGGLKAFQEQSLAGTQIDFEKDLKPWLGGVMVALLPPDATAKTDPPKLLVVVSVKNKISAWNFANKLKSQQGATTQETEYKGVKISEIAEPTGKRYSVALLNDQLVMAPLRKPVELAIDTFKGAPSLATQQSTTKFFSESAGVKNPIATVYMADYPAAMQQLKANLPDDFQLPSTVLSQFKQVKSLVAGIGADSSGLRVKTIAQLDPKFAQQKPPVGSKLLPRFPGETIALVGGKGLDRLWEQATAEAKDSPEVDRGIEQVRSSFKRLDLDADRDVFGWMNGEFAIGAIGSEQGILSQLGMGAAMIFETSDRPAAEATLKKLDAIAKSNPTVSVAPRQVQGKEVTEWQIPQQGTLFGHGWLNENSVFVAFGGPLVDVITTAPPQPLSSSPSFQAIATALPQANQGYFYIDMEKTMSWANRYLLAVQPNLVSPPVAELLNSLRGVSVATTSTEPTTAQLDLLFAFKSNN
ncbi:MAG: DUF3352 domain-containing protein [Microcoleus sp. PH2017_10_PVI_O_A]|uniref:DUF3352 domain-containing protein n=1 Tax=unclassified Microcoleus TaxID=2642155 RepID=UPI001DD76AC3|nr:MULTISPECIES: DUF3352 domain-containing protein [unclassified Microcoleus]TAE78784.1 MAG: DUF3352 domain-containing protein [Oscillatoriales cyanobacterium]MCC3408691.1 DUF3352 domain-containing protein [Microcoleus sp. PH2017_10_PVI_O_A]MCC3462761.1 DUF3352 domain-containing protein [Microcoleus sp. PH2017_11_PCY_U_A]MCC3481229.1 DUF3352 domain-containing protein [Microcoleus sp. PH2017_12_PCY_D_A]MCC3531251.1 DUF3352 domain-containing protein [Microcoleus sp. PH2017_21_RUC_O_A]